jgi:hypothetical protein
MNNQGSTDHVPFDSTACRFLLRAGPPRLRDRTHHPADNHDYAKREDLMQSAVVLATFLYQAAQRPEPLPRKPLPQAPREIPKPRPAAPAR